MGGSERCVDDGYERDPFLEQKVGVLGRGNGGEIGVGGGEADALAGEGEEGLEDDAVALGGQAEAGGGVAEPVVEKDGWGDGGMVEEGDGEFADVKVPVGMAGPFDVEGLAVIELEGDLLADQLVDNGAVVDAADGDEAGAVAVAEAAELAGRFCCGVERLEVGDVDDANAEAVGGDVEVREGFLVRGIDVDEDDGLGIVAGDDGAVEEVPEGGCVLAAEEVLERGVEGEGGAIGLAGCELKSEDGGEGLHFDETRGEGAGGFTDEAEVGGEEVRVRGLAGCAPGFRDGGEGAREVGRVVDEAEGEVNAGAGHFVEERLGEEAGSLGDGEGDVGAGDGVEGMEQVAEGFWVKAGVEVAAEVGDHREG